MCKLETGRECELKKWMESVLENTEWTERWRIRWIDWLIDIWSYSNLQTVSPKGKTDKSYFSFRSSLFQDSSEHPVATECVFIVTVVPSSAVKYMFGTRPLSRGVVCWWGDRPIQQCICDWRWTWCDRIRHLALRMFSDCNLRFGGLLICCSETVQKISSNTKSLTIFQCHLLIAARS